MIQSQFFEKQQEDEVICTLCPHRCRLVNGNKGICGVRKNINGNLIAESYGKVSAIHFDPIEKKPLYHYYPGSQVLSIGTLGCNLSCKFCQNYHISQSNFNSNNSFTIYKAEEILDIALRHNENIGVSFTYNEPSIWFEYVMDVAYLAKQNNLVNTMVTNGFINPEPLDSLLSLIDGFNVDLKAFTDEFYHKYTGSRLTPVLKSIKQIHKAGKHLEITNLIIPGLNDDPAVFRKMVKWITTEVGKNTVLHLSRYFPTYKMSVQSTPVATLHYLFEIAREYLDFVFFGNVHGENSGRNTQCPKCKTEVIIRDGYFTELKNLTQEGKCSNCGEKILKHTKFQHE